METDELKRIWKTLADKNLVEKEFARENIQRILSHRSSGIISRFEKIFKRDIMITWGVIALLTGILIFLYFFSQDHPVDPKAPFFILAVFLYFVYKQYSDLSKKRFITRVFNKSSIRDSLIQVKENLSGMLKADSWIHITFIMIANAFAIFVYLQWVRTFSTIDFTRIYMNTIAFYILIFLVLFFISAPWVLRYFGKRKFAKAFREIESMLEELREDADKSLS